MSPRKPRRPTAVVVEPVHARPVRGPHKDGSGRWYWQGVVYHGQGGKDRTVWRGWARRDEVTPILADLIVNQGLDQPDSATTIETVRDLLEVWIPSLGQRPDISASYRSTARNAASQLCEAIGDVYLDRVSTDTLHRVRDDWLRSGTASGTVMRNLKVFRTAWRWGRELRLVDGDCPRFRVKVVPTRDKRTPTRDEVLKVIGHLERWPRLVMILLHGTGARLGEVAALTWGNIDLTTGVIAFRISKTGHRAVPIHADVVEALRQWKRDTDTDDMGIFRIKASGISSKFGERYLDRACEAVGIPRFTPHGLRRAAVDALQRAGEDVGTAAKLLGHSPAVMLMHYRQPTADDLRKAVRTTGLGSLSSDEAAVIPFPGPKGDR